MGVAVADFDNDGLPDIYVTGFGGNALYRNLGNCKFEDVTDKAGVAAGGFSTGAAWADYDRDGFVDLYVSRYVHFDMDHLPTFGSDEKNCRFKGILVQCGPWGMIGESDLLFHNRGDGTFEEVSKKAGMEDTNRYYGLGVIWGDYDNDGWPDLYVANDAGPNYLYHNKHDGTFEEVGMLSGIALGGDGQAQGSMGVDWGDYLHEGRLSMFVTNFHEQPDTLYRNHGERRFFGRELAREDRAPHFPDGGLGHRLLRHGQRRLAGYFRRQRPRVPASGFRPRRHNLPPAHSVIPQPSRRHVPGCFQLRLPEFLRESRRGAAFGDINNDGNIDVVMVNVGAPPTLLLNQGGNSNHRVLFKLCGNERATSRRSARG